MRLIAHLLLVVRHDGARKKQEKTEALEELTVEEEGEVPDELPVRDLWS